MDSCGSLPPPSETSEKPLETLQPPASGRGGEAQATRAGRDDDDNGRAGPTRAVGGHSDVVYPHPAARTISGHSDVVYPHLAGRAHDDDDDSSGDGDGGGGGGGGAHC